MDIDLGSEEKFNVSYGGQVYVMREPSVKEISAMKGANFEDQNTVLIFLEALGLPQSVSEKMSVSKIKKLVDVLVGAISEKK